MPSRPLEILLVEDSPGDVELIRQALDSDPSVRVIRVANDGVEAIEMLIPEGDEPPRVTPDLVLLDINLPRKNGHEVLECIRRTPSLETLPVVILTTSSYDQDVDRAYRARANAFVTKPALGSELFESLRETIRFWSSVATLPPRDPGGL